MLLLLLMLTLALTHAPSPILRSISWHAAFWNFYGGVGFLIGGAAVYAYSFK